MSGPYRISLADLSRQAGLRLGPSAPITIDQESVDRFAKLTRDHQWIHVDAERAEREVGGTLVHGYFALALIPYFVSELIEIRGVAHGLNYGSDRIRFPAPLPTGTSVGATLKILAYAPRGQGGLLRLEINIVPAQGGTPVCVAETLTLLYPGDGILGR